MTEVSQEMYHAIAGDPEDRQQYCSLNRMRTMTMTIYSAAQCQWGRQPGTHLPPTALWTASISTMSPFAATLLAQQVLNSGDQLSEPTEAERFQLPRDCRCV